MFYPTHTLTSSSIWDVILTFYLAFCLVYIFWHSIWHSIWHSVRHFIWYTHTYIYIPTFYLAFYLTSSLAFFYLAVFVAASLTFGARRSGPAVPTEIGRSRLRSGSAHWDLELAVDVQRCPLRSIWHPHLRPGSARWAGARGWRRGWAVPTDIWSSWWGPAVHRQCPLISGARGWGEERRRRRRRRTQPSRETNHGSQRSE